MTGAAKRRVGKKKGKNSGQVKQGPHAHRIGGASPKSHVRHEDLLQL